MLQATAVLERLNFETVFVFNLLLGVLCVISNKQCC